jgi:hypothetical protein
VIFLDLCNICELNGSAISAGDKYQALLTLLWAIVYILIEGSAHFH